MTRILYILIPIFFLSFISCDNDIPSSEVPSIVANTFKSQFPDAVDVEWETVRSDYEVSFELENVDHDALLDNSGNILKYKYKIEEIEVPTAIRTFLETEYPQEQWDDPEHIIEGNSNYYQLEIEGFLSDKKMVIDSLGNLRTDLRYWN